MEAKEEDGQFGDLERALIPTHEFGDDMDDAEAHRERVFTEDAMGRSPAGYHSDTMADKGSRGPRYRGEGADVPYARIRNPPVQLGQGWNRRVFTRISDRRTAQLGRKARATRLWRHATGLAPASSRGRVACYCTCDVLHTDKLMPALAKVQGRTPETSGERWTHTMFLDTAHSSCGGKDIFYMTYGCVVFWGMSEPEELAILALIKEFEEEPVSEVASDDMAFLYGDKSRVSKDMVVLESEDPTEKLAVSFAMAQSVKLSVFEARVASTINETKYIPVHLAETGKIGLSQLEISKQIGSLFIERGVVNLHSELLDTPEYFWDSDAFEHVWENVSKYLDVSNRVDVLNRRLDIIRELLDMLNDQLTNQHASKLEWIVIWLIVVEVVLQLLFFFIKDVMRWFPCDGE
mmetsp:Transcript_6206/g.19760  ORF Transcript_6206/g.19760 Transcript_6206/m.19760 type:complete len:406 (+) Transcript_6206:38-1255(+)|eukprot:CAMPEP_0196782956 /NCGR_PEP_ID=MMETSP1104-20130614/12262_1 /TAXON_ID=33652 /ORGANISM="Cafeteria sp., Strain Caron Lab Isolate" /LENGTH=405 /DNA_ID=CAMNT_0042153205 /DNA_START=35 /DNA_END=1252 /DNA_ORIENTATION=+